MDKLIIADPSQFRFDILEDLSIIPRERKPGLPERVKGMTVGIVTLDHDAPHGGEIHPDGDELLYVISGKIRIIADSSPHMPRILGPGEAAIVKKGEWHKVDILEPTQLLHATPGPHGDHRPLAGPAPARPQPKAPSPRVELREITQETARPIARLSVKPHQNRFVAPNLVSLAEANFSDEAWFRGIYADGKPAGFVMLADATLRPSPPPEPTVYIWRFMIDQTFQGRGVGKKAMALVLDHIKSKGVFSEVTLSYVPGEGSPEGFYRGLGFEPTGEMDDDEVVMKRAL